nr:hypothetical protein [Tanacetum cinerariifolium]
MAAVNDVSQPVDKKGGNYAVIAPKLEPRKFNKWKKRMLCYLAGMEPYYLKCIEDGLFQPKTAKGNAKPESQWTPDERRVFVQDQRLKSIIMSCLPDDIMESVISCVSAKETWTDLVHSFEGPSDTKKNRIMDLKLEYQTFRAKSTESLSHTYTRYKTLLNELANDGGVRNANHTQTLDLADIYGRFLYEDNLIQRRDCFSKTSEPSCKSPVNNYSLVSKGFQPKFTLKLIQSSSNSNNQADPKFQKDYKAEYKKMKAKLALLEASPSSSQNPKTFQPKNKGLVVETFDWDEEEVSDEEEVTQVKVLMALADDELTVGKSHAHNGEWVDITIRKVNTLLSMDEDADWQNYLKYINIDLKFVEEQWLNLLSKYNKMVFELDKCRDELLILKQAKLDAVTFQIQNTEVIKLNHALQEQLKEEKKINEKWLTIKKGYDQKMVPKTKDWVERLNPDSKLPNFNTGRILAQPYQYASSSKQILKAKAKPFPPCTHCGFNDHIPDNCRNYPECGVYGSYDHSTSGHNCVIHIRGGVLAESSQSNESSIGVKCNTCGSTIHPTSNHNEFDHFKRGEKIQAAKAWSPPKSGFIKETNPSLLFVQRHIREPISGLSEGLCCENNQNSLNDSPSILENSSQSPPLINHHCCYECGDPLDGIFCKRCTCKSCGKGAHIGHNYPQKVSIISNPEPCKNQTIDELPQTSPSFHLTCYSGDESPFTCDSTPNIVYDSPNVFNPPPQPPKGPREACQCDQLIFNEPYCEYCGGSHMSFQCQPMNEDCYHEQNSCYDSNSSSFNQFLPQQFPVIDQTPFEESMKNLRIAFQAWSENIQQKEEKEKQIAEEQAAKAQYWKIPICYDDDEDYTIAITPKEPDNSLSMGDEHLNTISATESDEFIKSSVENLVPNQRESEGKHECDVPASEDFTTFSNLLFDADDDFSSSDDQSFSDEDISKKIYSNPLFDEEIISMKIDPHHFNAESDLIESLLNHDFSIISSFSKIDSLLDEFAGIEEDNYDSERGILILEELLSNNSLSFPENKSFHFDIPSSSRPLAKPLNDHAKGFCPPVFISSASLGNHDSDSCMKEIDLSFTPDDPMPPGIEEDNYDSERDILILEELLSNNSLSFPENKSFHFGIPSSSRPLAKPPNGNSRILNVKVMGDISEHNVPMPKLMLTQPTRVPNQEKSPNLLSHHGHEASQPSTECPMISMEGTLLSWMFHFSISIPIDKLKYGDLG